MTDRKLDHIELAFKSQTGSVERDERFIYEPLLLAHPEKPTPREFLGKKNSMPMWVSSMTGGTQLAKKINENLARACKEFGMGMGLGSCRTLLDDDTFLEDFNVRKFIGYNQALYANLGIAQVDLLLKTNTSDKIKRLLDKLKADGLIIHVNPLQEWFQPEGNIIERPPIEVVEALLELADYPVIVKEVGQGMGKASLNKLLQLPIEAIEFGAFGGTNFSMVELLRGNEDNYNIFKPFAYVGQSAEQMVRDINEITTRIEVKCDNLIISGGVKNFLDGYYLMSLSNLNCVYGQASGVLKYAKQSYEELYAYLDAQYKGYALAEAYLTLNPEYK